VIDNQNQYNNSTPSKKEKIMPLPNISKIAAINRIVKAVTDIAITKALVLLVISKLLFAIEIYQLCMNKHFLFKIAHDD
jgi:hypothetical protein